MGINGASLVQLGVSFFYLLCTEEPSHQRDARQQSGILHNAPSSSIEKDSWLREIHKVTLQSLLISRHLPSVSSPALFCLKNLAWFFVSLLPNFSRVLGLKKFCSCPWNFFILPYSEKSAGQVFSSVSQGENKRIPLRRKISEGIVDFEKSITFASLLAEQY